MMPPPPPQYPLAPPQDTLRPHSIGVLVVGLLRGLRSPSQRNITRTFLSSLGPPDVADIFALFELYGEETKDTVEHFGLRAVGSKDQACSPAERDALFALSVGADTGRLSRVRLETQEEVQAAINATKAPGVNSFNFYQFHKLRLAFEMLEQYERERGGERYAAVLRLRSDQTFAGSFLQQPGWLRPQRLVVNRKEVFLHHDALWIAGRDAFGQLSQIWDVATRMRFHLKARAYSPLDWPRVARSSWAVGSPRSSWGCSLFLETLDVPVGLVTPMLDMRGLRMRIFRDHERLGAEAAALDPHNTSKLDSFGGSDHDHSVNAESFLGSVILHEARPLGPLVLSCASTLLGRSAKFGLLPGRHALRC